MQKWLPFDYSFVRIYSQTGCSLDVLLSKLQSARASCYRFRAVFKNHLKSSLRLEILTVAYDG